MVVLASLLLEDYMQLFKVTYYLNNKVDYTFELGKTTDEVKWTMRRKFKGCIVVGVRLWRNYAI